MIVSIASDHAGFTLKQDLADYLRAQGYEVRDLGPESEERVDYPDFAAKVAREVQDGEADCGVLVCGTGIGMSIAANRFKGVRAANVVSAQFAALSREHNDANILCLSARFVDEATNKAALDAFLHTEFEGGRHAGRVIKIDKVAD